MNRVLPIAVLLGALVLATGATSPSPSASASATTVKTAAPSPRASAEDLTLTPALRRTLLDVGAKYHTLKPSDYLGLQAGTAYYALDIPSKTYYAAAGLDPSPHSLKAQVSSQDDGGYILFVRHASSKRWRAYNDGLGMEHGVKCPIVIPSAVLSVWGWAAKSCYPPL